jgi:CYTH domain-containing protein
VNYVRLLQTSLAGCVGCSGRTVGHPEVALDQKWDVAIALAFISSSSPTRRERWTYAVADSNLTSSIRGPVMVHLPRAESTRHCEFSYRNFSPTSAMRKNENMPQEKYARVERERRFLPAQFPSNVNVVRNRRIVDHYIEDTTLRIRKQSYNDGLVTFKLTQKIPMRASGSQQGFITSIHLTEGEFHVLTQLPARKLTKTRFSVPPFGIDVFDGTLQGLILAEAEFDSAETAEAFPVPSFVAAEVSADERFTGGQLVRASRQDMQSWLSEYGLVLTES